MNAPPTIGNLRRNSIHRSRGDSSVADEQAKAARPISSPARSRRLDRVPINDRRAATPVSALASRTDGLGGIHSLPVRHANFPAQPETGSVRPGERVGELARTGGLEQQFRIRLFNSLSGHGFSRAAERQYDLGFSR